MQTSDGQIEAARNDAQLVAECLAGNREAFAQIVTRYQSLVSALAYSATGSLAQSQDLAQETFLTAWKELAALREPQKLRSWLCGIVRCLIGKTLRRREQEPIDSAHPLETMMEPPSPEPLPAERAISREEEAIAAALGADPIHIDAITDATGLPPHAVASLLMVLEVKKVVTQLPGKLFARR